MIQNDKELEVTQERITYFQSVLAQLRVTASPEEFPYVAGGCRTEIERMRAEIMVYLTRHASQTVPAEVA
jgi:hypothetical protein